MPTILVNIPDSLYDQAVRLAEAEKIPLEQLVSLALAHSIGEWAGESYIAQRAKRGDREKFLRLLARVPDGDSGQGDLP